jgi:hypothetical protein
MTIESIRALSMLPTIVAVWCSSRLLPSGMPMRLPDIQAILRAR